MGRGLTKVVGPADILNRKVFSMQIRERLKNQVV